MIKLSKYLVLASKLVEKLIITDNLTVNFALFFRENHYNENAKVKYDLVLCKRILVKHRF